VGGQGTAAPARLGPGAVRPGGLDPGQLPDAGVPLRSCRPLPALAELAAFGRDEGAKQTFYGLRAHLQVCWPGVIADGLLAPANLHDLVMAEELLVGARGLALGDRAYWSPVPAERLREQGVWLLAPPSRSAKGQLPSLPRWVTPTRRRIETVIGQLVERYHAKRVWARDAWHLWSRWQRKLLSHTLAVYFCQQSGLGSLRFADLVTT
jgi:hypothetical protein